MYCFHFVVADNVPSELADTNWCFESVEHATDNAPTITVTVRQSMAAGNILPKVTIVSPGRNGIFFSESETKLIPIEVKAPKGAVGRVEFYIDGNLEKVVTNAVNDRFKFEWNTEGLGNGLLHAIFVKGFDTSLNSSADMIVVRVYP